MKFYPLQKFLNALLAIQCILSVVIIGPVLYNSAKNFFRSSGLSEEERKEQIYGGFYRSLEDYVTQIPETDNAAIIEPPGDYAELFWILNYYFLPRKIYTFPDSSFLNNELRERYNIKYLIRTTEEGFYFERL